MSYQLSFLFYCPKTKIPLNNRTGSSNSQLSILFLFPLLQPPAPVIHHESTNQPQPFHYHRAPLQAQTLKLENQNQKKCRTQKPQKHTHSLSKEKKIAHSRKQPKKKRNFALLPALSKQILISV